MVIEQYIHLGASKGASDKGELIATSKRNKLFIIITMLPVMFFHQLMKDLEFH